MSGVLSVYLVDDQAMIRGALRSLLSKHPDFEVVGESDDGRKAAEVVAELCPDVMLLDITMPGISGLDTIPLIRAASPSTKIVMLTHHEGESFVEHALKAGAEGYLSKDSDPAELFLALKAVSRGDPYVSPRVAKGIVQRARSVREPDTSSTRVDGLTPREREIFQLLAIGKANKEIAFQLEISLSTVKKHRENLQRKLDCHSAAELARMAIREGLLEG